MSEAGLAPRARSVEATAPARVDLSGGVLDVWPVYLFHPGAVTIDVAIDRRAWCRVETGVAGVQLESKDTLRKAAGRSVDEVIAAGQLTLPAHVLKALGIHSGVRVVTQSRVPAGSGLAGSSALAVAIAGAASKAFDLDLAIDDLPQLTRDAEVQATSAPTGVHDYHTAIRGGAICVHLEPMAARVERLAVDPARVEESLLLVDVGARRAAASGSWGVVKAQLEGDARVRAALASIASVARQVRDALLGGRFDDLVGLFEEESRARLQLGPAWTTPDTERVSELVRGAGGAAKVCGRGGIVAVWAPPGERGPGRREAVLEAMKTAGLKPLAARVDLRGFDFEACA